MVTPVRRSHKLRISLHYAIWQDRRSRKVVFAPRGMPQMPARFYAQWIENAVLGTFDHQCLVFRTPTGEIRGYVSLRELNATEARIGLLAGRGREQN
jgi:hypothetical protein